MRAFSVAALLLAMVAFVFAQKADNSKPTPVEGKGKSMPGGLQYWDIKEGTGKAAGPFSRVTVHYTGWLTNGKKFDSSLDRGQPFSFTNGKHEVIQGWEEGVNGMKVGGKRQVRIPPDLGYGSRGAGNVIPPNATLIFDIELLNVK